MAKRVRVLIYRGREVSDTPDFNIWADVDAAPDHLTLTFVTLLCDYGADLAPAAGWTVAADGKHYTVETVSGRVLTCVEGGVS